jgi:hypothetical protein
MATRVDPNLASRVQIKRMNMHWFRYLKTLEDENDYQNWSGPPLAAYRAFKGD